jgi:6,7-dimethyl-8-ribityllumazine synthase
MKQESQTNGTFTVDPTWKIGIVAASFYKEETDAMIESARKALMHAGIPEGNILFYPVAGSFEIPLLGAALAKAKKVDALIGIGIIVQGETKHADLLAAESARGIMDVQLQYHIPFAFEVLWVNTLADAKARANKGEEAAQAVLLSLAELARLHS